MPRAARTSRRIRPIRAKRTILKSVGGKGMSLFSKPETRVPREGGPVNSRHALQFGTQLDFHPRILLGPTCYPHFVIYTQN